MLLAASDPPAAAALTSRNSRREKLLFVMATPGVLFSACQCVSLSFVRYKQYALRCNIATRLNNPSHGGFCMTVRPITHSMTATAFALEGYRTTRTLGVVRGVTVRSRSIFGTIGASLQTL